MRCAACLLALIFVLTSMARAEEGVEAHVAHFKTIEKKSKARLGQTRVEHQLAMGGPISRGGLKLYYRSYFKPEDADHLVLGGWAPVVFGCLLGPGYANGQWDRWSFMDARVKTQGKVRGVLRSDPLLGMRMLEQGRRGLADVVWRAAGKNGSPSLCLRVMKLPDARKWAYFEVCALRADDALVDVVVGGYPHSTTPNEARLGRRRWFGTAKRRTELKATRVILDAQDEYWVVLFNKGRQEDAGLVLLFSPREVAKAEVYGTYAVRVRLTPKPGGEAVHFACSYFADERFDKALTDMGPRAEALLARLGTLDWSVRARAQGMSAAERKEARELLAVPAIAQKFAQRYQRACAALAEASRALREHEKSVSARRAGELRYGATLAACRQVLDGMRQEWLRILPID